MDSCRHFLRSSDVFVLRGLVATTKEHDDRLAASREVETVARSGAQDHFAYLSANTFVFTEVSKFRPSDSRIDSPGCRFVSQRRVPIAELLGPLDDEHVGVYPRGYKISGAVVTQVCHRMLLPRSLL
jgi:hypothetical protein